MNNIHKEEKVASNLWKRFSKEEIKTIKKIPTGFKNKSFYIKSKSNNEFVLKIYAQNFLTREQIEERGEIVKRLENNGVPTLEMVRGLDSKFAQEITDKNFSYLATMSKYIEIPFSETQVSKEIVSTIAKELRKLHKELEKIKYSNNFKRLDVMKNLELFVTDESVKTIKEHFNKKGRRSKRADKFLKFYIDEGNKLLEYFNNRKSLFNNYQLNHGDFNLNNFLVEDGKIIKIFDFDEMIVAPKSFEIGLSIYHLNYPEEFYPDELLEIYLRNYFEKSEITKQIINDILHFMKYRAYYRMARYFTYYQFTSNPGGYFTKFENYLRAFNNIDSQELYEIVKES